MMELPTTLIGILHIWGLRLGSAAGNRIARKAARRAHKAAGKAEADARAKERAESWRKLTNCKRWYPQPSKGKCGSIIPAAIQQIASGCPTLKSKGVTVCCNFAIM
jgi:hypothetical protein